MNTTPPTSRSMRFQFMKTRLDQYDGRRLRPGYGGVSTFPDLRSDACAGYDEHELSSCRAVVLEICDEILEGVASDLFERLGQLPCDGGRAVRPERIGKLLERLDGAVG